MKIWGVFKNKKKISDICFIFWKNFDHSHLVLVFQEDSGAFDVYVLQIIQSFLYEKWTRIVHWDSTKRRVGLDYTLEVTITVGEEKHSEVQKKS